MGDFLSAVGEIATNESAYRNAMVAAIILLLAALGELVAEKAGTINISLEGMMLAGAFAAAIGQDLTGSVWVGLAFAVMAGVAVAMVQSNMSHRLPADQFVVGLVLNVLVLGVVGFLAGEIDPTTNIVGRTRIPLLADIPLLGPALFDQPWVLYLAFPMVPAFWYLIYRSRWGLEVRAVGEDPNAADVSGLHVNRLRRQTIHLAGVTAGLAGAMLLFARSGRFEDSLVGGRGFIAIAAVIFGGWTLKGTVAGCIVFGIVGSFVLTIPNLGYESIDPSFLAMAPSVVTIAAMAVFAKRVRPAGGPGEAVPARSALKQILTNGDIVTMNADREVLVGGAVVFDENRVIAVGSTSSLLAEHGDAAVYDAAGRVVTPGMVNAHQHHTGDPLVRSCIPDLLSSNAAIFDWAVPIHSRHSPDDDELSATLCALESLRNGVTTVIEAGTVAHPERVAAGHAGGGRARHDRHVGLGHRRRSRSPHRATRCSIASARSSNGSRPADRWRDGSRSSVTTWRRTSC